MARLIGDAYIVIYPQGDQFAARTEAIVKRATAGLRGNVPVSPQLDKAAAATVKAELKALGGETVNLDAMLSAQSIGRIKAELDAIAGDVRLGATLNPASVAKVEAQLKAISDSIALGADLDPRALAKLELEIRSLTDSLPLGVKLNPADLVKAKADLNAIRATADLDIYIPPQEIADAENKLRAITDQVPVGVTLGNPGLIKSAIDRFIASLTPYDIPVRFSPASLANMQSTLHQDFEMPPGIAIPGFFNANTLAAAKASLAAYIAANGGVQVPLRPVVNPNVVAAMAAILQTQFKAQQFQLPISVSGAMAQIAAFAQYARQQMANALNYTVSLNLGSAVAQLLSLKAAAAALDTTFYQMGRNAQASAAIAAAGTTTLWTAFISGATTGWGALNARISLFAGLLDSVLPHILASVSVWHLAVDWVLEFAAVLVPAALAVTAFGLAITPVVLDAGLRLQAMQEAASALGVTIGKLNFNAKGAVGPMQALQNTLQPTVWQLTGDAIVVMTAKTGVFQTVVKQVNTVVQDLAARMTAAFTSPSASNFMKNGALDFQRFGTIIGNLGGAFGNFLKAVPGYAEIIQELFVKVTAGIEAFTAVTIPIIHAGLALHGFVLYVGLAITAGVVLLAGIGNIAAKFFAFAASSISVTGILDKLGTSFKAAGTSVLLFLENIRLLLASTPVNILVALGLAAYDLYINFNSASSSVATFSRNIVAAIDAMQGGDALQSIPAALGSITQQMKAAASPAAYQQLAANWSNLSNTGNAFAKDTRATIDQVGAAFKSLTTGGTAGQITGFFSHIGSAIKDLFVPGAGIPQQVTSNINNLQNAYNQLTSQEKNLLTVTGQLMTDTLKIPGTNQNAATTTYTWAQALGILDAAGVQAGDGLQTMQVKVAGMLQGWQQYGLTATQIGNAVNALALQSEMGQSSISKLTSAYSNFISVTTGGETALATFGTGLSTISQALSSAGATGIKFTDTLGKFSVTGTAAGATLNGISQASLNARSAFASEITNAAGLYNSLLTLSSVSAQGAKGQNMLAQAGKDMVAMLLPLAKGSSTAVGELSSLAQIAGGPATTNFATLAAWVGKIPQPMQNLNSIEQKLSQGSINLLTDTQNLAGAMGQTLTTAIANAVFAAEQGPQAMMNLANSLQNLKTGKGSISGVTAALKAAIPALTLVTGSSRNAEDQFLAMAASMGIGSKQATALWNAAQPVAAVLSKSALQAASFAKTMANTQTVLKSLPGALKGGATGYQDLFTMLTKTDAGLASGVSTTNLAKQAFINFAMQGLHVSAQQAQAMYNTINTQNLVKLAGEANMTEGAFVTLTKSGFNVTTTQAQQLWTTLRLQYLDTLAAKASTTEGSFVALAKSGLGISTTQAQQLWATLRQQYLDTVATKAGETKKAFEGTASQFGLTKGAADKLWDSLHKIAADSPYNAKVNADTSQAITNLNNFNSLIHAIGSQSITIPVGVAAPTKVTGGIVGAASGRLVTGSGPSGRDSTLIMAAPGELIVPASHAPKFADMARKSGIPGFQGGGVAGGDGAAMPVPGFDAGGIAGGQVFRSSGSPYSYASQMPSYTPLATVTASQPGMPGMTAYQANTLIQLMQQQNKLLAQMPYSQAQAINQANSAGVRRGYFATSG